MGLWQLSKCRCYNKDNEKDTFHSILCDNEVISIKREEVFNQIFTFLDWNEMDNELKEMILQILVGNEEYYPLE